MFVSVSERASKFKSISNKLDGSFYSTQKQLIELLSLLVLLYLSYVNLFKELFLLLCGRRESAVPDVTKPSFRLLSFVLESGCKGIAFLLIPKTFEEKCLNFICILTVVYK